MEVPKLESSTLSNGFRTSMEGLAEDQDNSVTLHLLMHRSRRCAMWEKRVGLLLTGPSPYFRSLSLKMKFSLILSGYDRAGLYRFLLSLKQPDGSFVMHIGGEVDVR